MNRHRQPQPHFVAPLPHVNWQLHFGLQRRWALRKNLKGQSHYKISSEPYSSMSLNFRPDVKKTNVDKQPWSGCYDVKLSLYLYCLTRGKVRGGVEVAFLTSHWMYERVSCRLGILLDHWGLERLPENALRRPHAYCSERTVRAAPSGLTIYVASVHLQLASLCTHVDVMICQRACQRITHMLQAFTVLHEEATQMIW